MKRFLFFSYHTYYPMGGIDDVTESFDTLEEALEYYKTNKSGNHIYIFDCDLRAIVWNKNDMS